MYGRRNNLAKYEFIAPCHFGLEAVLKKEVVDLGYEVTDNGKYFMGAFVWVCLFLLPTMEAYSIQNC